MMHRSRPRRAGRIVLTAVFIAAICGATLTSAGCAGSPAYLDPRGRFLPRLRLKVSDRFSLRVRLNQKLLRTYRGKTRRVLQYYAFTYDFQVREAKAEGYILSVTYRRVRVRRGDGNKIADFDSEAPGKKVPAQLLMYKTLKGRGFTLVLDERGRVMELRDVREMVAGMVRDLGLKRKRDRRKFAHHIALQFGPDTLRESMQALFIPFPEKPLRGKESWTSTASLSRGIPLRVSRTWTLEKLDSDLAVLRAAMILKPDPKAPPSPLGLMRARYYISGTQTGETKIDPRTGLLRRGEMHQLLSGKMRLTGGPLRRPVSIPMRIDSRIDYQALNP